MSTSATDLSNVGIECPERGVVGEPLVFRSNVTGGPAGVTPIYEWTVSAGSIIDGQGTGTIRVDTTGLAGQSVTATLRMGGYRLDCSATCTVQFPVPVECRKFDEFPAIAYNDEKARLDNYAIELQNDQVPQLTSSSTLDSVAGRMTYNVIPTA